MAERPSNAVAATLKKRTLTRLYNTRPSWLANPLAAPQTSEAPAASAPADNALADIVVTAQRRVENLQRAALPVSAVAGDTLVTQSITRADDLTVLRGDPHNERTGNL